MTENELGPRPETQKRFDVERIESMPKDGSPYLYVIYFPILVVFLSDGTPGLMRESYQNS